MFRKESPLTEASVSFTDCTKSTLQYVTAKYECGNEVITWVKVKLKNLAEWRSTVNNTALKCIDYLNLSIPGSAFKIKGDSQRLEDKLSIYGYDAMKKLKLL